MATNGMTFKLRVVSLKVHVRNVLLQALVSSANSCAVCSAAFRRNEVVKIVASAFRLKAGLQTALANILLRNPPTSDMLLLREPHDLHVVLLHLARCTTALSD